MDVKRANHAHYTNITNKGSVFVLFRVISWFYLSRSRKFEVKEKALYFFLIAVLFPIFTGSLKAQDDAAKECAELQKSIDQYAVETKQIELTLSFKTNTGYWKGASEELSFGTARRRVAASLQQIAYKLGVKRLKDWDMVPLQEKLTYQQTVARALEREKEKSITVDQAVLETRAAEIEKQLKTIALRVRDLGCADLVRGP
jgi:hypothetical protein